MEEGATIKHDLKKSPKTGDWKYSKPEIDKDKCIGCATCVAYCPEASIEMNPAKDKSCGAGKIKKDNKMKAEIDYDFCKGCGVCAAVCPVKAIKMTNNK